MVRADAAVSDQAARVRSPGFFNQRSDRLHAGAQGPSRRVGVALQARAHFTPPVVSTWPGPLATLLPATAGGGSNWEGGSFDPETKIAYLHSTTTVSSLGLVKTDGKRSDMDYIAGTARDPNASADAAAVRGGGAGSGSAAAGQGRGGAGAATAAGPAPANAAPAGEGGGGLTVRGLPLAKPPYARITAIDLNKGEILWSV